MCRMVINIGRCNVLSLYYDGLIKGLIGASSHDPFSEALFGKGEARHGDGWGTVAVFAAPARVSIYMYKSTEPIYIDKPLPLLQSSDYPRFSDSFMINMVHARAATAGTPVNIHSTHPVEMVTRNGYKLYMVHNGSFAKDSIEEALKHEYGVKINEKFGERYNDTYFAAWLLAEIMDDGIRMRDIERILGYSKTAGNLGITMVTDEFVYLAVGSYYRLLGDSKDEDRANYYRMYLTRIQSGGAMFASSTIVAFDDYRPAKIEKWEEVDNGYFEVYRVSYKSAPSLEIVERGVLQVRPLI